VIKLGLKDEDLGWNDVVRDLGSLTDLGLDVGVFDDAVHEPRGIPITLIAAVNEYGSAAAGIPARPVFAKTFETNERKYTSLLKTAIKESVGPNSTPIGPKLQEIGDGIAGDIKKGMHAFSSPVNADSTIAKKGEDNPWIHTGQTVEAVQARLTDTGDVRATVNRLGRIQMRNSRGRFVKVFARSRGRAKTGAGGGGSLPPPKKTENST
tara:strand:- start:1820 stop:2446 length:627 start_codon:yes stop_codon:yes gene_type:complete